jgi:hypothetical protein
MVRKKEKKKKRKEGIILLEKNIVENIKRIEK